MRQLFFSALFAISTIVCSAQAEVSIFAGPQITSSKYTVNGTNQSTTNKYGFQLGTSIKIPFENKLYFSPAAFYSLKGYKVKLNQPSNPPNLLATGNNTRIHTLEIAALLQYDFSRETNHFFLKLGPSLDFQLYGKEKLDFSDNTNVDQKMIFSFEKYGRYAASLLVQVGYETNNGLLLSGQYSHGIGSINNADLGPRIWHRVYGISIGKCVYRKNK